MASVGPIECWRNEPTSLVAVVAIAVSGRHLVLNHDLNVSREQWNESRGSIATLINKKIRKFEMQSNEHHRGKDN